MAGPVPTYLSTQTSAQSNFTVPFGLLSFVNAAIANATAAGEFNVTVDCSLFVTEDVSNLRIYLDSLGYKVDFAKDTGNKSLNIDWGKFLDVPGTEVVVDQGTTPWVVSGTVAATQSGPWTVSLTSGSIEIGTVDQGTPATASNAWPVYETVGGAAIDPRQIRLLTTSDQITAFQGTSPWVVSGTVTANLGTVDGLALDATLTNGTQHTLVDNFPATQPVSGTVTANQGTSPWVVSGTVTANAGTGTFLVDGSAHTQPVSGTVTANAGTGTFLVDGSAHTQPVSGTVTANAGTGNFTVVQPTGTNLHAVIDSGTVTLSGTSPVSGTVTSNQGTPNTPANKWPIEIVDSAGVNVATVDATGDLQVDINNFPATVAVTQSTSPWVVSGTVTANVGTTGGLALDATLTNSTQKTQIVQGGNTAVVDAAGDLQVDVNNFPATQTVAGTVTANQGTANTAANKWPIEIVDSGGVNVAAVNATNELLVTDTDLTLGQGSVTLGQLGPLVMGATTTAAPGYVAGQTNALSLNTSGGLRVDGSGVTQPISGTVTANAGTGNFTVVQPTGTNLHTVLDSGTLTSITNALPAGTNVIGHVITDSGSTTAVTGNVTVVQPTGTNLHTVVDSGTVAATQSGTWTVQPGNTANTTPWLMEERSPTVATYSASTLDLVAAATPTDIFTLYGSGTKTVKVTFIAVSATQNTAAIRDLVLIKRSATNTGGTSSAPTIAPHDSNNAAATATVLAYTANPSALGASVGNLRTTKTDIPATNLVGNTDRVVWEFGTRPAQPIVLRGTSQGIAINLNGVTSSSNSFDISIEWSEE